MATRTPTRTLLLGKYAHKHYSFAHFNAYTTIDDDSHSAPSTDVSAHAAQSIMLIYGLIVVRMTQAEFNGALWLGIIDRVQGKPFIN